MPRLYPPSPSPALDTRVDRRPHLHRADSAMNRAESAGADRMTALSPLLGHPCGATLSA
jgi:hypothetical protein